MRELKKEELDKIFNEVFNLGKKAILETYKYYEGLIKLAKGVFLVDGEKKSLTFGTASALKKQGKEVKYLVDKSSVKSDVKEEKVEAETDTESKTKVEAKQPEKDVKPTTESKIESKKTGIASKLNNTKKDS